jgi:hypothetical protein
MSEIRCPTCDRMLVREKPDGSVDLGPEASVTLEASITEEQLQAALSGNWVPARATALPLSARCLVCHPEVPPLRWWWRALAAIFRRNRP